MAGGEDEDQKTEQPTSKKLEDAYKKGNVPFSREVGNFMIMLMIALTVSYFSPNILRSTTLMLTPFLSDAEQMPVDASGVGLILSKLVFGSLGILAVPVIGAMVVLIASSFAQNGFVLSGDPIQPQLSRISIFAGIKRLFSIRSVMELIKSVIKILGKPRKS